MNIKYRASIVRSMEMLVRCVNEESLLDPWLMLGVADGDIDDNTTDEDLEYYCDDETFAELMQLFLNLMSDAREGGLYADGVLSK